MGWAAWAGPRPAHDSRVGEQCDCGSGGNGTCRLGADTLLFLNQYDQPCFLLSSIADTGYTTNTYK